MEFLLSFTFRGAHWLRTVVKLAGRIATGRSRFLAPGAERATLRGFGTPIVGRILRGEV